MRILTYILAACIVGVLFLGVFKLFAFSEGYVKKEFVKYNVYGQFPLDDIDKVNHGVLTYLRTGKDYDKSLFNANETRHLEDVRGIVSLGNLILNLFIIIGLISSAYLYYADKRCFLKRLSRAILMSGIASLIFALIIAIFVILGFDWSFTTFHHIFFPQGNWLFSDGSNIVKLYPEELFFDAGVRIFGIIAILANILIFGGIFLAKKCKAL